MSATAQCPDCSGAVRFGRPPEVGQRVVCPSCRSRLEVTGLAPIELDWAADVVMFADDEEPHEPYDEYSE